MENNQRNWRCLEIVLAGENFSSPAKQNQSTEFCSPFQFCEFLACTAKENKNAGACVRMFENLISENICLPTNGQKPVAHQSAHVKSVAQIRLPNAVARKKENSEAFCLSKKAAAHLITPVEQAIRDADISDCN